MLSLDPNLAVDHGKLRALWDVSDARGHGRTCRPAWCANGAGKSTAMGAIVGLYAGGRRRASSFDGAHRCSAPQHRRRPSAGGISHWCRKAGGCFPA
jgi:ABC-type branched-subunit amino acid transport system ATPase component